MPAEWPQGLRHKNLLFVIDDITFHCAKQAQHPRAGEMVTVGMPGFQERLRRTLDWFASACGEREVRVLATARDEPEYWEKLDFSERDPLWRHFTCYPLQEPEDAAVARLLEEAARQAGISAAPAEFPAIAAANDSTFSNVVENLRRAQREGRPLTLADYRPHAQDTWAAGYQDAVRKHPPAKYLYDALDLLVQAGMHTRDEMVVELGARLWGGGYLRRPLQRRQVRRTLDALVVDRVLAESGGAIQPRDGQVAAKGCTLALAEHFPLLTDLALWAIDRWGKEAVDDIYGLGWRLWQAGQYEQAVRLHRRGVEVAADEASLHNNPGMVYRDLGRRKEAIAEFQCATELDPRYAHPHNNLGAVYSDLGWHEGAIIEYQRAIELDPNVAATHYNLGDAYAALRRREEAIAEFQCAIELDPKSARSHNGLGNVYADLEWYEEAIAEVWHAIELDPNVAGYYNLGNTSCSLGRHEQAIAAYQRAIKLDSSAAGYHNNLGSVYRDLGRYEQAIAEFQRAIELDPKSARSHNGLGNVYAALQRHEEAIAEFRRAIELDPSYAPPHFNWALLEAERAHNEEALEHLRQVIELEPQEARRRAREHKAFESLRDGPRFRELVGEE